jgi:hypothetical protein
MRSAPQQFGESASKGAGLGVATLVTIYDCFFIDLETTPAEFMKVGPAALKTSVAAGTTFSPSGSPLPTRRVHRSVHALFQCVLRPLVSSVAITSLLGGGPEFPGPN